MVPSPPRASGQPCPERGPSGQGPTIRERPNAAGGSAARPSRSRTGARRSAAGPGRACARTSGCRRPGITGTTVTCSSSSSPSSRELRGQVRRRPRSRRCAAPGGRPRAPRAPGPTGPSAKRRVRALENGPLLHVNAPARNLLVRPAAGLAEDELVASAEPIARAPTLGAEIVVASRRSSLRHVGLALAAVVREPVASRGRSRRCSRPATAPGSTGSGAQRRRVGLRPVDYRADSWHGLPVVGHEHRNALLPRQLHDLLAAAVHDTSGRSPPAVRLLDLRVVARPPVSAAGLAPVVSVAAGPRPQHT